MTPLHPGDQLDHYYLDELVAQSGMASIFRGKDLRTGARVAVKVPHPEAECDPVFYERFQREAQIGRDLDHPGISKVMPESESSRVYMAMAWADGQLLREVLAKEGRLSPERATRIALSILETLDYIHTHGVVHRDLKPENVLIDSTDQVKLIDFGIAAKAGARRLTFGKFSQLMGTPDYISPEQAQGKRGDLRSDLYALGVMLYEMLSGKAPFHGPNPLAVMNARLKTAPIPLSQAAPDVPRRLQEIVHRALEKDPRHRYTNAGEFADALRNQDRPEDPEQAARQHTARDFEPLPNALVYSILGMIPVVIFGLMFLVARNP